MTAMPRLSLRLLADDLTGALDSAAAFASAEAPVPVVWRGEIPEHGSVAFDSATREISAAQARLAVRALAPRLWHFRSGLAFKKVDSLLRGHEAAELCAIVDWLQPDHCIVAPAFPAQNRVTHGGRQWAGATPGEICVETDLVADLVRADLAVHVAEPGDPVPRGVSFWNARTDADLDLVVARADGPERTLWVGSGGLAAALARRSRGQEARAQEMRRPVRPPLGRPVLGLIGSDQAVARRQLERLGRNHVVLAQGGEGELARLLAAEGVGFASVALADGLDRRRAAAEIAGRFARLADGLPPPGTLVVAGGETLRGVCDHLGTARLDVIGEMMPGIPCSVMRGGRWDGVAVVSKSGAFGGPDILKQIVTGEVAAIAGAAA
ncbi:four-carbon acid sugar kinase family protein [Azorhizobium doebereinerae]|uniref:four-carbon acid sugar kinase family protein n=1 Tax=Azorhizobium doebereinerae TaxID=281091 RepID=UPI000418F079|nr:four-carbon acid sugar kinase family protein [Azorhizobium doebereinerae]